MNTRTRLTLSTAVLLVGAVTTSCGGASGAPTDASKTDFCEAQASLFKNLKFDVSDPEASMPTEKDMADAMQSWSKDLEKVGTPEDISDDARAGFEKIIEQSADISEDDLKSPDLNALEDDMSKEEKSQAEAFATYTTEKCGSVLGGLESPVIPEMPETNE